MEFFGWIVDTGDNHMVLKHQ
jgi:hypothetical protein